jgi:hypothetical protein
VAAKRGSFCTGSDERRTCLPYIDEESKGAAFRAIRSSASRGAEITHCVGTRRNADTCYVSAFKQPTNLTLAVVGVLGLWGYNKLYGSTT